MMGNLTKMTWFRKLLLVICLVKQSVCHHQMCRSCVNLFEEMMIREKIPMPGKDYIGLSLLAMARLAQRQKTICGLQVGQSHCRQQTE